jgi:hypothetical protein
MSHTYDEPDEGDDYDAETDYDPEDPDTYPAGLYVHGDERAVVPCPHCKVEIDEESEQCPKCGMFISKEDPPGGKWPLWVAIAAILLLLAFVLSIFR